MFLGAEGPLADELREAGATVEFCRWYDGRYDPAGASRFVRLLHAAHPGVVHRHIGGRTVSTLTRVATRARVLAHVHGTRAETGQRDPSGVVVSGADAIVATSYAAAASLRATARIIPPGVPVPAAPPALPDGNRPLIIGTAGRLAEIKGVIHLVRALRALLQHGHEATLEILGEGPCEGELRAETRALELDTHVRFLGWHANVGEHLQGMDVYVQPSLYEGFGIATLEAMAQARPVVATAVGGTPELVTPVTGLLVPPGKPSALAEAIGTLLADVDRRRALGRAAWERAQAFTEDEMVRRTSVVYDELLDPLPSGRLGLLGVASRARRLSRGVRLDGPAHCIKRGYLSRVAPRYFSAPEPNGVVWQPTVYGDAAALARDLGVHRIIDIGSGAGTKLMGLAPEFETIGLDFGPNLTRARRAYPHARWVEHDLDSSDRLPLSRPDLENSLLLAVDVIEHLRKPRRLLHAIAAALQDCRAAILTTPDRDLTWGIRHHGPPPNPAHVREWNSREFELLLRSEGLERHALRLVRSNDCSPREHTILVELRAGASASADAAAESHLQAR